MARPIILYATGGSNSQSSGSGETVGYGAAGASTGAYSGNGIDTNSAVISLIGFTSGSDLTNVAVDGSSAIWLDTPAGEQVMFRITAKNDASSPKTVTVHQAPDSLILLGASAVAWAIGGSRLHPNDDTDLGCDFAIDDDGWTYEFGSGTHTHTLTGDNDLKFSAGEPTIIRGEDGQTVTLDVSGAAGYYWASLVSITGNVIIQNLRFNELRTSSFKEHIFISNTAGWMIVKDCYFTSKNKASGSCNIYAISHVSGTMHLVNCEFDAFTDASNTVVNVSPSRDGQSILNCSIHDNDTTAAAIKLNTVWQAACPITGCTIFQNGGDGIGVNANSNLSGCVPITSCTIFKNDGDGISYDGVGGVASFLLPITNCAITDNGDYGISATAQSDEGEQITVSNCLVSSNVSGQIQNTIPTRQQFNCDITSDPGFTSETLGSEDFTPGTGSALLDAGIDIFKGPESVVASDIGAVPDQSAGGGGGTVGHAYIS